MKTAEIKSLFDTWNDALQTRDPDAVTALYAADAVLLPTVSNAARHNHAEIRDYFVVFLSKNPSGKVIESNVRYLGDTAVHSGVYVFDLHDGEKATQVPARFTFVYGRQDGDWKIIEHHSSQMPE